MLMGWELDLRLHVEPNGMSLVVHHSTSWTFLTSYLIEVYLWGSSPWMTQLLLREITRHCTYPQRLRCKFSNLNLTCNWQIDRLMQPNTPHMVYTIENSICRGSHFYATSTLTDSLARIVHCLIADNVVTNTSHIAAWCLLLCMIHFFHEEFIILDHDHTGIYFIDSTRLTHLK